MAESASDIKVAVIKPKLQSNPVVENVTLFHVTLKSFIPKPM